MLQWARARLPVGRAGRARMRLARPPRGAAVGARSRLPVERGHMLGRGAGRPPRDTAVGARERLPVGQAFARMRRTRRLEVLQWARENDCPWKEDTCWRRCRRRAASSKHCSGRARTAARGTRITCKLLRRLAATSRCCSGRTPGLHYAVGRGDVRVHGRWAGHLARCCSGRAENGCPWDEVTCKDAAYNRATSRCCSGRARTTARGTRRRAGPPGQEDGHLGV